MEDYKMLEETKKSGILEAFEKEEMLDFFDGSFSYTYSDGCFELEDCLQRYLFPMIHDEDDVETKVLTRNLAGALFRLYKSGEWHKGIKSIPRKYKGMDSLNCYKLAGEFTEDVTNVIKKEFTTSLLEITLQNISAAIKVAYSLGEEGNKKESE